MRSTTPAVFPFAGAALVVVAASLWLTPALSGLLGAALGLLMLAIARSDLQTFLIPDTLTATALGLGIVAAVARVGDGGVDAYAAATSEVLLRGAVVASAFLLMRMTYRWLRKRHGLGLGDVKLAGVAGAWLDWDMVPIAIAIAALAAISGYVLACLSSDAPMRRMQKLPFGLFLAPVIWLCWALEVGLFGF
jgi:leader peptidase (prepilin peptidase)/N-methyltransferase